MKTGRFKLVSEAEPQKEKKDLPFFGKSFFSFCLPERLTSGDIRNPRLPPSPEARRKPGFLKISKWDKFKYHYCVTIWKICFLAADATTAVVLSIHEQCKP